MLCRSLRLSSFHAKLSLLTSPHLQSFSLISSRVSRSEMNLSLISQIAGLTALTSLELDHMKAVQSSSADKDCQLLQHSSLMELCLVDCIGVAKKIIVPGGLPALQKLHIVKQKSVLDSFAAPEGNIQKAPQQYYANSVLPQLVKFSGLCRVLLMGMPSDWELVRKLHWGTRCRLPSCSFVYEQHWRKSAE